MNIQHYSCFYLENFGTAKSFCNFAALKTYTYNIY